MATADFVNGAVGSDAGFEESLDLDRGFYVGRRAWRVATTDKAEALQATGIPPPGEPWGPDAPSIVARSYTTQRRGSRTYVIVRYLDPSSAQFGASAAEVGDGIELGATWTDVEPLLLTVRTQVDAYGAGIPGDPADVIVPAVDYVVNSYATPQQALAILTQWEALAGRVNNNIVTVPNLFGEPGLNLDIPQDRALVHAIEPRVVRTTDPRVVQVGVRLGVRADWRYRSSVETGDGTFATSESVVYEYAAITGLWL